MNSILRINIPQPCDADWQQMIPDSDGRYCSHCQKRVIDFTSWSDEQLYRFFATKTKNVCGSFYESQINRPIALLAQPQSRFYRMAMTLGLTLIFTNSGKVTGHPRPPFYVPNSIDSPTISVTKIQEDKRGFSGVVLDSLGRPVPKAEIRLFQNSIVQYSAVSDVHGEYTIPHLTEGRYDLVIDCMDFTKFTVNSVELSDRTSRSDVLRYVSIEAQKTVENTGRRHTGEDVTDFETIEPEKKQQEQPRPRLNGKPAKHPEPIPQPANPQRDTNHVKKVIPVHQPTKLKGTSVIHRQYKGEK